MKNKELMIGIPTKDHPKYIQYYMARVLEAAKKYNIDIHIYDSSSNDETKNIVFERQRQGYNNVFYHKYGEDIKIEDKLEYIFADSGYEYVWLCGDGVVINIEKDIAIVEREIVNNRDLIVFGKPLINGGKRYVEYDNPVELLGECFAPITYYGASIVRGDIFKKDQWKHYKERYLEQVQPACFFEYFAKNPMNAVYIAHDFFEANPYKKMSDWMKKGRTFEAFAYLMERTVEQLPEIYNKEKKKAKKSIDEYTGVFGISHLWALRTNGNLSFRIAVKYRKCVKKVTLTRFTTVLLIAICPKRVADTIAVILGNVW